MSVPVIGQDYRGVDGKSGYPLRQAWHLFRGAMEDVLRASGLNSAQYAVLSVLRRSPGGSGAALARACNTTPQAMNGVLVTLERDGLIERRPHPTHGRILQATLTAEGRRRLDQAEPAVRGLEQETERDFGPDELAVVKRWLVTTAQRMNGSSPGIPS